MLTAVDDLINTVVTASEPNASESKFAYILDGKSNLMISASIAGISTDPDGQVSVFDCGIPEIEVSVVHSVVEVKVEHRTIHNLKLISL